MFFFFVFKKSSISYKKKKLFMQLPHREGIDDKDADKFWSGERNNNL